MPILPACWAAPVASNGLLAVLAFAAGPTAQLPVLEQEHPLEPPATSSPRETLFTFLEATDAGWALVRDEGSGRRSAAGRDQLFGIASKATRTLDKSEIASDAHEELVFEALAHLYEILCRIELPPPHEIPDRAQMDAAADPDRWTIPHTEITIHRVPEGPRRGEFLFSPETIARLGEFYGRVEHLPYRRQPPVPHPADWRKVHGGWHVRITWIDALPAWMRAVVWGQAWWKWITVVSVGVASLALVVLAHRITRRRHRRRSKSALAARLAVPIVLFGVALLLGPVTAQVVNPTGAVGNLIFLVATAVAYLALAWAAWLVALLIGEATVSAPGIGTESLDASLIRLTARVLGAVAAVFVVLHGASQLGLPLLGLVASLSVGGLAVALAAQDTLKSLLGSLMIFTDQPYRVGERIVVEGHDGIVERIGLRSTRIRRLDGHLTSIPNEIIATCDIENIGRRESIRRKSRLRLATGTPRAKVEEALAIVRDILRDHEGMPPDKPPRVFFDEFNPDSLCISIHYWFAPPDYWAFCAFGERTNLEILRRFDEAGIELAPPTTATQLLDGSRRPLELRAASGGLPPEPALLDEAH